MNKTFSSHQVFDVESEIIKANAPCPVELRPWQDRIDKIAGKTPDGKSRVRLTWGQAAQMKTCGLTVFKYPFWRHEDGRDIGTPRFYVEELHGNAELQAGNRWEQARWYLDPDTKELLDVLGPIPAEGFYTAVFCWAHHDELCCGGREVYRGEPCLGAYLPPTDSLLTRVRRMKQQRDAASLQENAPSAELLAKRAYDASEKRDEMWRGRLHESVKDWMTTHGHRITDSTNPKFVKSGGRHFITQPKETNVNSNSAA